MSHLVSRIIHAGGMLSALALVPVGAMMSVFGYAEAVLVWLGFKEGSTSPLIVIAGLLLTFSLHCVPLALIWTAGELGSAARPRLGLAMLLLSPLVGWYGFDSLVLRGDWGDVLLWGPYLLTGLFMAAAGGLILIGRFRS